MIYYLSKTNPTYERPLKGIFQKINIGFYNKHFVTLILMVTLSLLTKSKHLRKRKKKKYKDPMDLLYLLADWLNWPADWLNRPEDLASPPTD